MDFSYLIETAQNGWAAIHWPIAVNEHAGVSERLNDAWRGRLGRPETPRCFIDWRSTGVTRSAVNLVMFSTAR